MKEADLKDVCAEMKKVFDAHDIVIVTARQQPPVRGYRTYVPPNHNGVIIIDYLTKMPRTT